MMHKTKDTTVSISAVGGALVALDLELDLLDQKEKQILIQLGLVKSKKQACTIAIQKILSETKLKEFI